MAKFTKLFLVLSLILVTYPIIGCDDSVTRRKDESLPPDPQDWVCRDSATNLTQQDIDEWCMSNPNRGQPLPLELRVAPPLADLAMKNIYDIAMEGFLRNLEYIDLGWKHDRNWRMTGPYLGEIGHGQFFGVHSSAVRIYYSPEIIDWLCNNREGEIPDGAMIVKEQYPIDESLGIDVDNNWCMSIPDNSNNPIEPTHWTIYVRNNSASFVGWYGGSYRADPGGIPAEWAIGNPPIFDKSGITSENFFEFFPINPNDPIERNPLWYPSGYIFVNDDKLPDAVWPYNQYGNWCINCHASAVSESTFSTLVNVITRGTQFKQFSPDLSLLQFPDFSGILHIPQRIALYFLASEGENVSNGSFVSPFTDPLDNPTDEFLEFYDQIEQVLFDQAFKNRLPAETYDHIVSDENGPQQFLTSDQCIGCHDATFLNSSLPNMILEEENNGTIERYNLSPYAEWKASPLGQAGRDPIFFAQVESETNFFSNVGGIKIDGKPLPDTTLCFQNTCLHCHGVMGQRQFSIDTKGQDDEGCSDLFGIPPSKDVPIGAPFSADAVMQWPLSENNTDQKYGSLARDGISCTVCHHIVDTAFGEEKVYTGNFVTGPADELYGPYQEAAVVPMENSLKITPKFGEQTKDPDVCGTCHNILLPVVSNEGNVLRFSYEQTTHLEWENSDYAIGRPLEQTCQDCHMPNHFRGKDLSFVYANIESASFPPVQNRVPDNEIELQPVNEFFRHTLHGLNVFLNEMFQQFPLILGARQIDFMTGIATVQPLINARNSFLEMAENDTAEVEILSVEITPENILNANIKITNKAGHYLPSGVSFRRVFIEFLVRDSENNILWASGRTNSLGAIIEGVNGPVLPSEQPLKFPDAPAQPHYQVIDSEDQVQIYQELIKDSGGKFTTSFVRRVDPVKNNRIRPVGFDPAYFANSPSKFIRELARIPGEAANDPYYTDPSLTGADEIEYRVFLDNDMLSKVDNIQVTLYNQSIPPFYLQDRFNDASVGVADKTNIERLYYLTSHLNVDGAMDDNKGPFIKDWKLFLVRDSQKLN